MMAALFSFFLVVSAALCVQSQRSEKCGMIFCPRNTYCSKLPNFPNIFPGLCTPYLERGYLCDRGGRCRPDLECQQNPYSRYERVCLEPSNPPDDETTTDSSNLPDEPTVTPEPDEGCGMLRMKCGKDAYCFRVNENMNFKFNFDMGICMPYLRRGQLCNEGGRCRPELECQQNPYNQYEKVCLEREETTTTLETSETPETSEQTEETSEQTEETSEQTEETSEQTAETSEQTEETSEQTEETSEQTEETSEETEETSGQTEETSESPETETSENPETETSENPETETSENPETETSCITSDTTLETSGTTPETSVSTDNCLQETSETSPEPEES